MMIKLVKIISLIAVMISVSGCATTKKTSKNSDFDQTRNHSTSPNILSSTIEQASILKPLTDVDTTPPEVSASQFGIRVIDVNVIVPERLRVSEANAYSPIAAIVWREDPPGDRHDQVKTIVEDAILDGVSQVEGNRKVIMHVRVNIFHALTEVARESLGGIHEVKFDYVLLDPTTGHQLTEINNINIALQGLGGRKAKNALLHGETQKARIHRKIVDEIYTKLSNSTQL